MRALHEEGHTLHPDSLQQINLEDGVPEIPQPLTELNNISALAHYTTQIVEN
jgi:hypothetical protein